MNKLSQLTHSVHCLKPNTQYFLGTLVMGKSNGTTKGRSKSVTRGGKGVQKRVLKLQEKKGPASHYYVIFTMPNFFKTFISSLVVQLLAIQIILRVPLLREPVVGAYDFVMVTIMTTAHRLALWSVISLLSSSCCAFQLILNMFSVGCAGLNSTMGPLRPFFIAVTTISQLWQWISIQKVEQYPQAFASLVLTTWLTFLPEILYIYVHFYGAKNGAFCPGAESNTDNFSAKYSIKVSGMNCIACVQTIKRAIESTEGVKAVDVQLEQGEAHVLLAGPSNKERNQKVIELICENVMNTGFEADPKQACRISQF